MQTPSSLFPIDTDSALLRRPAPSHCSDTTQKAGHQELFLNTLKYREFCALD
uniref:Uncharacterized protein n=1 Tax=Anguilla anguilla TaxID=7936 RepID=A0A0E9W3H3_ANGAN